MIDRDSLDKLMLADIIEYCQERGMRTFYLVIYSHSPHIKTTAGLKTEGAKADLIEDLISWVTMLQLHHTRQ